MNETLYDRVLRFKGEGEIKGEQNNGFISWCHSKCGLAPDTPDEVPWCSSFLNGIAWIERLPRSYSAAARSWLEVGVPIPLDQAKVGYDVVIFKRGPEPQPGPEVTKGAPGHVAMFGGREGQFVIALGGNQGDKVSLARFHESSVLGIRRLYGT